MQYKIVKQYRYVVSANQVPALPNSMTAEIVTRTCNISISNNVINLQAKVLCYSLYFNDL